MKDLPLMCLMFTVNTKFLSNMTLLDSYIKVPIKVQFLKRFLQKENSISCRNVLTGFGIRIVSTIQI